MKEDYKFYMGSTNKDLIRANLLCIAMKTETDELSETTNHIFVIKLYGLLCHKMHGQAVFFARFSAVNKAKATLTYRVYKCHNRAHDEWYHRAAVIHSI